MMFDKCASLRFSKKVWNEEEKNTFNFYYLGITMTLDYQWWMYHNYGFKRGNKNKENAFQK